MKRLLTLFFVFTAAFLISSCATIYLNQKYLIGTWKPEKLELVHMPNHQTPAAGSQGKTNPGAGETKPLAGTAEQTTIDKKQISKSKLADLRSSMTFNADKTVIKEDLGKTIHATWKLKNNGTRLLTSDKGTGEKSTFDILYINDTSAVVIESFPSFGLKITYKKVKK